MEPGNDSPLQDAQKILRSAANFKTTQQSKVIMSSSPQLECAAGRGVTVCSTDEHQHDRRRHDHGSPALTKTCDGSSLLAKTERKKSDGGQGCFCSIGHLGPPQPRPSSISPGPRLPNPQTVTVDERIERHLSNAIQGFMDQGRGMSRPSNSSYPHGSTVSTTPHARTERDGEIEKELRAASNQFMTRGRAMLRPSPPRPTMPTASRASIEQNEIQSALSNAIQGFMAQGRTVLRPDGPRRPEDEGYPVISGPSPRR
ncbi:hypothetical protein BKA70DRAFT_1326877 [Coprinopsis sp. MPI-PUGE-AT-0042]|nr:hypothetical protein BKA70DRAFT_1326877 [Coprinopsis sp. MPI-PUGE-AT-0042]